MLPRTPLHNGASPPMVGTSHATPATIFAYVLPHAAIVDALSRALPTAALAWALVAACGIPFVHAASRAAYELAPRAGASPAAWAWLVAATAGLLIVVLAHRAMSRAACPECGRPPWPDLTFCAGCGAWLATRPRPLAHVRRDAPTEGAKTS